jgi:hypothetical protein
MVLYSSVNRKVFIAFSKIVKPEPTEVVVLFTVELAKISSIFCTGVVEVVADREDAPAVPFVPSASLGETLAKPEIS